MMEYPTLARTSTAPVPFKKLHAIQDKGDLFDWHHIQLLLGCEPNQKGCPCSGWYSLHSWFTLAVECPSTHLYINSSWLFQQHLPYLGSAGAWKCSPPRHTPSWFGNLPLFRHLFTSNSTMGWPSLVHWKTCHDLSESNWEHVQELNKKSN